MEVRGQSSFHGKFLSAHTQTPWKSCTARQQLSAKWPAGKHVILGWRGTRQRRVKNGILLEVLEFFLYTFFSGSIYGWWMLDWITPVKTWVWLRWGRNITPRPFSNERFQLPRPSIPPRTHISPADTLSADLFSCTEGQSPGLCKKI